MLFKITILVIFHIYFSSAALFIWSNHEIKVSPFEKFRTTNFLNTIEKLNEPDVYVFKSPNPISVNVMSVVKGFYSMFSPNGEIEMAKIIDLTGNSEEDLNIIKTTIGDSTNFVSTIIIPSNTARRSKRDIDSNDEDTGESDQDSPLSASAASPPPKEPVIYRAFKTTKDNEKLYALLYSSGPLLFRKTDSNFTDIYLGNADDDMIIYDTRLNVKVPHGRGKIILRFNFTWQNGYWYMPSVKIRDIEKKEEYNLVTKEEIVAPARFSYHCNGQTKYSDFNGTELIIYDLQVQTDSRNGKFGDANDCVPFTTAPICSGIFITIILGIGMIIALISIMDIKTMDKFDNYKTKNLVITVSE